MDRNIKVENKQFYKYWKKESKDWRRIELHAYQKYRMLSSLSERVQIPIYVMVDELLVGDEDLVSVSSKMCLEEKFDITISDKEFLALLGLSGFEYKPLNKYYYCNDERSKRIQNACDATRVCLSSHVALTFGDKMKVKSYNRYIENREKLNKKIDKLALEINSTATRLEPANGERIGIFNGILSKIILISCIVLFFILIIMAIKLNIDYRNGIETAPFWNVLVGACIPGVATVFTTFMIIRNEYKVDYHQERMGALPVFSMNQIIDKAEVVDQAGKWDETKHSNKEFLNTSCVDDLNNKNVVIYKLTNKGYGMAFDVQHDKGDEIHEFGDIAQEENYFIAIKEYDKLIYVIEYMDVYGNKYTQRFRIIKGHKISSFPPELVLRTELVRYQQ